MLTRWNVYENGIPIDHAETEEKAWKIVQWHKMLWCEQAWDDGFYYCPEYVVKKEICESDDETEEKHGRHKDLQMLRKRS